MRVNVLKTGGEVEIQVVISPESAEDIGPLMDDMILWYGDRRQDFNPESMKVLKRMAARLREEFPQE